MNNAAYICGMETIIYFEKKRDLKEPVVEPIGMKTYMLVRVGLDVEPDRWFGAKLGKPIYEPRSAMEQGRETGEWKLSILHPIRARRLRRRVIQSQSRECEARYEHLREYHIQLEQWRGKIRETEEAMSRLHADLTALHQPREPIYAVYEDALRKVLFPKGNRQEWNVELPDDACKGSMVARLWYHRLPFQEFTSYIHPFWVEQLVGDEICVHLPRHVLIIGRHTGVNWFLRKYAPHLKSINWLLPERDCEQGFEQFLEDFYEEFGLVIGCRTYSDEIMLRRENISGSERTLVFDFAGGENLPAVKLAEGSLWVDLYASESKQRKVQSAYPALTYISLKSKWKQAQKSRNKPFVLDIVGGNGYNTWESEGMVEPSGSRR